MKFPRHLYYRTREDLDSWLEKRRWLACPGCGRRGRLILYGSVYGVRNGVRYYRGRRVYCNRRRKHRRGCGLLIYLRPDEIIKGFVIKASELWSFLRRLGEGLSASEAIRAAAIPFHMYCGIYLRRIFGQNQSHIRHQLLRLCQPPDVPWTRDPCCRTVLHMRAAFPDTLCPVSAYQSTFQRSFMKHHIHLPVTR